MYGMFKNAKFNCTNKITLGTCGYMDSDWFTGSFDEVQFCDGMVLDIDRRGDHNKHNAYGFYKTVFKETKFSDRFVVDDEYDKDLLFVDAILPDFITATKPSEIVKQFNEHYEIWKRNNPDKAIDDSPSIAERCKRDLLKLIKSGKSIQDAVRALAVKYPENGDMLVSVSREISDKLSSACFKSVPTVLSIVRGSKFSNLTVGEA